MPSVAMVFDIIARDAASPTFTRMGREASGASRSVDGLLKASAGLSALMVGFAVHEAVKFESAMTRISTQAGVSQRDIKGLGDSLLKLSPKVGFNPDELALSLYHVESAFHSTGISAKNAGDLVANAAKLAKIGGADLETTTQAVVGVLASKIKGVRDAADAAAQLNQLVGTGDTTLQKVAASIATGILPTAQSLGLSFKDVAAALATLTDNVTPADEAATRLRTTLSLVENPSPKAAAALRSIGLSSVALAEDFRKPNGLLVALEDLKTHLNNTYSLASSKPLSLDQITKAGRAFRDEVTAQGASTVEADKLTKKYVDGLKQGGSAATLQARVILQAFGGARSGATFLTLFNELDRLQSKYKDFGTSAQAAAKFQNAWAQQQQTAKQKLDDLKASWDVFLVKLGNAILPDLKKMTDFLSRHPGLLKDAAVAVGVLGAAWAVLKISSLITELGRLAAAILGIGTASATAATETTGSGLGGAVARNTAGAGRAAGLTGAARFVVPVAITYAVLKTTGLDKSIEDILKGDLGKALAESPKWVQDLGYKIGGELGGSISQGVIDKLRGQTGKPPPIVTDDFLHSVQKQIDGLNNKLKTDQSTLVQLHLKGLDATPEFRDLEKQINAEQKQLDSVTAALGKAQGQAYLKALHDASVVNPIIALPSKPGFNYGKLLGAPTAGLDAYSKKLAAVNDENDRFQTNSKLLVGSLETAKKHWYSNSGALDGNSRVLADNNATLLTAVNLAKGHSLAVYAQTGNLTLAKAAFADGIKSIEDNAVATGKNRDQVHSLIENLIGAKQNSKVDIVVNASGTFSLKDLFNLPNQPGFDLSKLGGVATGGPIYGPGTGTSDSILRWLSNGEHVWTADEVARAGGHDAMYAMRKAIRGHADGGAVELGAFNAAFPPTTNRHVEALEKAMNAEAQKWFAQRRQIDSTLFDAGKAGPGQSFSLIIDYMRQSGIPFTQADPGLGRGGHSYHEAGDAVDFSGGDLNAMAAYWHKVAFALLEEIHSPNFFVKNGKDVGAGFYGPAVFGQHFNHVHIAAGLGAMQNLLGTAAGIGAAGGAAAVNTSGGSAAAKAYAQARLASMGEADQFGALLQLWTMESSWNPSIVNSSSGAYGIPQALPAAWGHPYALGDWQAQVDWGLNYIAKTYGSPSAALNHEHRFSWYDAGGVLPHGGLAANASGKPEMVLTNAQWAQFARFVKALETQEFIKYAKAIAAETTKLNTTFTTYVQNEQAFRDTLKGNITQGNTFNDLIAHAGTPGDVKTLITGKITDIKAFVSKITALRKAGWPSALIREIANDGIGPGTQYADVLLAASKSDKASIIGLSNSLTQTSTDAANWITWATGQTGLTVPSAVSALNKAIFTPGANAATLTNQAAKAQAAAEFSRPLMHVEHQHVSSTADMQLALKQAAFQQRAGTLY